MFKQGVTLVLVLLYAFFATSAHAFIDPPYITPTAPVAGEMVSVNIGYGVCDAIRVVQSITQEGHAIRVLFSALRYTDPFMCNLSGGLGVYPIGAYPSGSYTLQVDIIYPGPGGMFATETLAILPFIVPAAPISAVPAPINNHGALVLLMLALLGLVTWKLRTRETVWLFILVVGVPLGLRAQDAPNTSVVQRLLTTAAGAPTPEQRVDNCERWRLQAHADR